MTKKNGSTAVLWRTSFGAMLIYRTALVRVDSMVLGVVDSEAEDEERNGAEERRRVLSHTLVHDVLKMTGRRVKKKDQLVRWYLAMWTKETARSSLDTGTAKPRTRGALRERREKKENGQTGTSVSECITIEFPPV